MLANHAAANEDGHQNGIAAVGATAPVPRMDDGLRRPRYQLAGTEAGEGRFRARPECRRGSTRRVHNWTLQSPGCY